MKSRETKAKDLAALTESLQSAKSAMVVSFQSLTVAKDQEFRNSLREAGAQYKVVKNTLARLAVKGTDYEQATDSFKGVTAIAWTDSDPVVLSKAISKFMKANADNYTFKSGVVDGKLVDLAQVTEIASLPSKEELISKLLYVINAQAQRLVTVINAVPRDLAVVIKQIGDKAPASAPAAEASKAEAPAPAEEAPAAEVQAEETPAAETEAPAAEVQAEETPAAEPEAPAEAAEEAQETREEEQNAESPEAEQAAEAAEAEESKEQDS
ncbi:MAG: 50S ribosomal protein L10 [Acidobacteria bacterium]|nr:50S ribosomal protein L10 [Acidobacteriota bacterium]